MPSKRQSIAVAVLLLLLIALAAFAAQIQALQMQRWLASGHLLPIGNPWKGTSTPNFAYYITINAIFVSILLLIPAMSAFILRRGRDPGPIWLLFWTAAWAAFSVHLYIGVYDVLLGPAAIFHDPARPPRVLQPLGDTITSLWWTVDVILGWAITRPNATIRLQRSVLHLLILFSALTSSIVLSSNSSVRIAGVLLLLGTLVSALYRLVVYPFEPEKLAARIYTASFSALNRFVPWYGLSTWGAVINLAALRVVLRRDNLHNTSDIPVTNPAGLSTAPAFSPLDLTARNLDGYFNDLSKPAMGCASDPDLTDANSIYFTKSQPGARFGRNIPLDQAFPEPEPALLTPSPRQISTDLLARRKFIPATSLNFLAAAWIQFQTHDWFNHGEPVESREFEIGLAEDDPWRAAHSCPMKIRRTRPDPVAICRRGRTRSNCVGSSGPVTLPQARSAC